MKKSNKKIINDKRSDSEESEPESEISEVLNDIDLNDFDENENENENENEEEGDDDDYDHIDDTELKKEIGVDIDTGDEDIFNCFYDIEQSEVNNLQNNDVPKEDRITMPYLTKYERVRVLGVRAKQIQANAAILVKNIDMMTLGPLEIAKIELSLGVIPFKIRRPLPNGQFEVWKISELIDKE
jgi:DNA-directed RNA polymerase I, II, and III subunit RPABC2